MKKLFQNQQGVSLVEVMVAAGISSVIALATMKINENAQKGMRSVATKASMTNHIDMKMVNVLELDANCIAAFDTNGSGGGGDPITLAEGATANLTGVYLGPTELAVNNQSLPGSNGEFNVSNLTFTRDTETSCTIDIELERNDGKFENGDQRNKYGGRHLKKSLNLGCEFNTVTNVMEHCSSRGTSALGRWDYETDGADTWLENSYGTAVLGSIGFTPPARLLISDDASVSSDWAAGLENAISMPNNYVLRWGDVTSDTAGVGIWGDATCVNFATSATAATPYLATCTGGTTITGNTNIVGTLGSSEALTVLNGGATITGNSSVTGTLTSSQALTVSSGGATITGNSQVNGGLTITGNESVGGNSTVSGSSVINGNETVHGNLVVNGGIADLNAALDVQGQSTLRALLRVQGASATIDNGISSGGNVAINGRLFVQSNVTASIYYTHSDRRFKEDILPLDSELEKLLDLEPVSYHWIDKNRGEQKELGLIAQEVEKVYPDLVKHGEDGYLSVNYQGLISPLINAVQDLYKMVKESIFTSESNSREIASLKEKNSELEKENEALKARLGKVEKALGL